MSYLFPLQRVVNFYTEWEKEPLKIGMVTLIYFSQMNICSNPPHNRTWIRQCQHCRHLAHAGGRQRWFRCPCSCWSLHQGDYQDTKTKVELVSVSSMHCFVPWTLAAHPSQARKHFQWHYRRTRQYREIAHPGYHPHQNKHCIVNCGWHAVCKNTLSYLYY